LSVIIISLCKEGIDCCLMPIYFRNILKKTSDSHKFHSIYYSFADLKHSANVNIYI